MKKIIIAILFASLIFTATACQKKETDDKTLKVESLVLSEKVKNWIVFTNPAFRYELRYPRDWEISEPTEDGLSVSLYDNQSLKDAKKNNETFFGDLIILGHSNWKENYTLEEFYRHQTEDLFQGGYEREEIKINGQPGFLFKNVRNRDATKTDRLIDVIALELGDRVLEIEIYRNWSVVKYILNTIKFYPSKVISNLQ